MARKGRKDTGELYDVFRKITSEQSPKPPSEPHPSSSDETVQDAEDRQPAAENRNLDIGRAFIVSYNTAVITFVAFIIILIWIYMLGIKRGENKVIQARSHKEARDINSEGSGKLGEIPVTNEIGTEKNMCTVEVYRVSPEKLDKLRKNIRDPLKRQSKVDKTYIAKGEDGNGYVLWVNTFPRDSIDGQTTLEHMQKMETRSGGKAFANARIVPFDKSRVIE